MANHVAEAIINWFSDAIDDVSLTDMTTELDTWGARAMKTMQKKVLGICTLDQHILVYFSLLTWGHRITSCYLKQKHASYSVEKLDFSGQIHNEYFRVVQLTLAVGIAASGSGHLTLQLSSGSSKRISTWTAYMLVILGLDMCCSILSKRALKYQRSSKRIRTASNVSVDGIDWHPNALLDVLLIGLHMDQYQHARIQAARVLCHLLDIDQGTIPNSDSFDRVHDDPVLSWAFSCCGKSMAQLLIPRLDISFDSPHSFPWLYLICLPNAQLQHYILRGIWQQRNLLEKIFVNKDALHTLIVSVIARNQTVGLGNEHLIRTCRLASSLVEYITKSRPDDSLEWGIETGVVEDYLRWLSIFKCHSEEDYLILNTMLKAFLNWADISLKSSAINVLRQIPKPIEQLLVNNFDASRSFTNFSTLHSAICVIEKYVESISATSTTLRSNEDHRSILLCLFRMSLFVMQTLVHDCGNEELKELLSTEPSSLKIAGRDKAMHILRISTTLFINHLIENPEDIYFTLSMAPVKPLLLMWRYFLCDTRENARLSRYILKLATFLMAIPEERLRKEEVAMRSEGRKIDSLWVSCISWTLQNIVKSSKSDSKGTLANLRYTWKFLSTSMQHRCVRNAFVQNALSDHETYFGSIFMHDGPTHKWFLQLITSRNHNEKDILNEILSYQLQVLHFACLDNASFRKFILERDILIVIVALLYTPAYGRETILNDRSIGNVRNMIHTLNHFAYLPAAPMALAKRTYLFKLLDNLSWSLLRQYLDSPCRRIRTIIYGVYTDALHLLSWLLHSDVKMLWLQGNPRRLEMLIQWVLVRGDGDDDKKLVDNNRRKTLEIVKRFMGIDTWHDFIASHGLFYLLCPWSSCTTFTAFPKRYRSLRVEFSVEKEMIIDLLVAECQDSWLRGWSYDSQCGATRLELRPEVFAIAIFIAHACRFDAEVVEVKNGFGKGVARSIKKDDVLSVLFSGWSHISLNEYDYSPRRDVNVAIESIVISLRPNLELGLWERADVLFAEYTRNLEGENTIVDRSMKSEICVHVHDPLKPNAPDSYTLTFQSLVSASPSFRAMLTGSFSEAQSSIIEFYDIDAESFRYFVEWSRSRESKSITYPREKLLDLLMLSDQWIIFNFGIDVLKEMIAQIRRGDISIYTFLSWIMKPGGIYDIPSFLDSTGLRRELVQLAVSAASISLCEMVFDTEADIQFSKHLYSFVSNM